MKRSLGLFSQAQGAGFDLRWQATGDVAPPKKGQVLVDVKASSVNPIDVKRASRYGRKVLSLKRAGSLPRILGNDLVGYVVATGPGVRSFAPGDRVWGVLDTGPVGAHATQAVLPAQQLQHADNDRSNDSLAVLPYTFCTLWKSLRDAGLTPSTARGRRVLVHGASGGLGSIALQVLSHWGALTTAICSARNVSTCLQAGATQAFDRSNQALEELPANFDAVLNFATWDDEARLACKLGPAAIGMASTTHPLLGSIDELGWVRGLLHVRHERNRLLRIVKERSKSARYAWTIFGPDPQALTALSQFLRQGLVKLPVGITVAADHANAAFEHMRDQRPGASTACHLSSVNSS